MNTGNDLKEYRRKHGLTMSDLSKILGVHAGYIADLEKYNKRVKAAFAVRLPEQPEIARYANPTPLKYAQESKFKRLLRKWKVQFGFSLFGFSIKIEPCF